MLFCTRPAQNYKDDELSRPSAASCGVLKSPIPYQSLWIHFSLRGFIRRIQTLFYSCNFFALRNDPKDTRCTIHYCSEDRAATLALFSLPYFAALSCPAPCHFAPFPCPVTHSTFKFVSSYLAVVNAISSADQPQRESQRHDITFSMTCSPSVAVVIGFATGSCSG